MSVIGFSDKPEEVWCVAGWAFRQILADVTAQYPEDPEMAEQFFISETQGGLHIDLLEPKLAAKITSILRQVATGILSGKIRSGIIDQPYGDARTIEQYREALQQLLEVVPSA